MDLPNPQDSLSLPERLECLWIRLDWTRRPCWAGWSSRTGRRGSRSVGFNPCQQRSRTGRLSDQTSCRIGLCTPTAEFTNYILYEGDYKYKQIIRLNSNYLNYLQLAIEQQISIPVLLLAYEKVNKIDYHKIKHSE